MAQEEVAYDATVEKSVTFTAFKPQRIVGAKKIGDAVAFYKSVFGAVETGHYLYLKRRVNRKRNRKDKRKAKRKADLNAEINLAGTTIGVSVLNANTGTKLIAMLETDEVEAAVAKAVAAGAVRVGKVSEGTVTDPFGYSWIFSSPAKKTENEEEVAYGPTVEKPVTFTAFKPQLIVEAQKVGDAVAFYKSVFGAVETGHYLYPNQELMIAGSTIGVSVLNIKRTKLIAILNTDEVEAAVAQAVAAGAVTVGKVSEGTVTDPFGYTWIFQNKERKW